jgi:DNA-directed RNA polymerase subunit RPC12/RpoP
MAEATTSAAKFGCPSCGRQFTWKPELAGKAAKCKCGATISVPAKPQPPASAPGAAPAASRAPAARAAAVPPPPPPAADEGNPLDAYDFNESETAAPPPGRGAAADTGARCPSCGAGVSPGAVLCVSCGFNLKTGQKMTAATGVAGGPPRVGAAAGRGGIGGAFGAPSGPKPVSRGAGSDRDIGGLVKLVGIPLVLIAVVGGAVFGFRKLSGNKADLGPDKGKDRQVRAMMNEDTATELKEWLKNGGSRRMVMGMTVQQADGLADRLYNMGAVKVYAFGGVVTASLAIELPTDADKRKELIEWQKRWHTDMNETPQTDVGQQFLLIKMRV